MGQRQCAGDPKQPVGCGDVERSSSPVEEPVRILVADDEPQVRQLMERILERQGWEVTALPDGQAAVAAWPPDGAPYDLVILDVNMPGLNGYETYIHLVDEHPEAHFLFVSGYADAATWRQLAEERHLPHVLKPFHPQDLVGAVRRLLQIR